MTLILSRSDVVDLLSLPECIDAVERAFRLHAEGRTLGPGVLGVPASGGGFHIKAAGLVASPLGYPPWTSRRPAARRAPAHVWARDDHDGHCALDGDEQARAEREPGPERHGATP